MKHGVPLLQLLALATTATSMPAQPKAVQARDAVCITQLPTAIESVLQQPEFAGTSWGAHVRLLGGGKGEGGGVGASSVELFRHNDDMLLIPASNNKLFGTASFFTLVSDGGKGDDDIEGSFTTKALLCKGGGSGGSSWKQSKGGGGVPVLYVQGGGDPSLNSTQVGNMAAAVAQALPEGGRRLEVVTDSSLFKGFADSWEFGDIGTDYGVLPESFVVDENEVLIDLSWGPNASAAVAVAVSPVFTSSFLSVESSLELGNATSVAVTLDAGNTTRLFLSGSVDASAKPASLRLVLSSPSNTDYFSAALATALKDRGVEVVSISEGGLPASCTAPLLDASMHSQPFPVLLRHCLKHSDNLFAELFLRHVGLFAANDTSYSVSLAESDKELAATFALNTSSNHLNRVDGSGLSRRNGVTTSGVADVLEGLYERPDFATYLSFLPIAGVDGTLANRYIGTPAQGILHAKTGTMTGVNALSGYVFAPLLPPSNRTVVFSLINNQGVVGSAATRAAIDAVGVLLAQLAPC